MDQPNRAWSGSWRPARDVDRTRRRTRSAARRRVLETARRYPPAHRCRSPRDAGTPPHLGPRDGTARHIRTSDPPRRSVQVDRRLRSRRPQPSAVDREAWNTFGDVGAAARSTARKSAEAADLSATIDDGPPFRVASVWVVRPSAANRALLARFPAIFGAACPGSSRGWVRALTIGAAPPTGSGLVWLDPDSGRITEWRHRTAHTDPRCLP